MVVGCTVEGVQGDLCCRWYAMKPGSFSVLSPETKATGRGEGRGGHTLLFLAPSSH